MSGQRRTENVFGYCLAKRASAIVLMCQSSDGLVAEAVLTPPMLVWCKRL